MSFDYSKLRGRIREKVGTEKELSEKIGRTQNYLTNVFKNKSVFSVRDVVKICDVCGIDYADIHKYFFCRNVTETTLDAEE